MLSLDPEDISNFINRYPSKDLPLMIHYWKLGLHESHKDENDLFNHLLKCGINWDDTDFLIKARLGAEVIKNIYLEKEPITIILKSHLLFEKFLDHVLIENKINLNDLSFFSKISLLKKRKILKKDIFNDLRLLNNLRNEYSHNYYFDIGSFDASQFSICKGLYQGLPIRRKKTKAVLNLKTLQYFVIVNILGRISFDFPYLNEVKIKKTPHALFFDDTAQEIGKMMALAYRQVEGSRLGLKINVEFCKDKTTSLTFHASSDEK